MADTKQAFILRDFKDAGTGISYTAGKTVPIEEGSYANYEHADLVCDPASDKAKSIQAPEPTPDA